MARIPPVDYGSADTRTQCELDRIEAEHGRVTRMKQTLAHHLPSLHALMEWYPLREEVLAFLGDRRTTLFVHAISTRSDCLICSTFFRRWLIDAGEDPDQLQLDDADRAVVDFGRQLVDDANAVSDPLFERLAVFLEPAQIVALTAFGGLMIATNVFNNAIQVDLDEYLLPYRSAPGAKGGSR